jgi:hypothetical protein
MFYVEGPTCRRQNLRWSEGNDGGQMRTRFWIEISATVTFGALAILTLIVQDWIEVVFGIDPDAHNGTAEWLIVVLLGAGVIVSALLAGNEWRRTSTVAGKA